MKPEEIISDEEIEIVHDNADFGSVSKREVVNDALSKAVSGFSLGSTASRILYDHQLVESRVTQNFKLTNKGQKYLLSVFLNYRWR